MRRHNQRVYRVARAVLGDDAQAEDLAQEAWVRVYEHLGAVPRASALFCDLADEDRAPRGVGPGAKGRAFPTRSPTK